MTVSTEDVRSLAQAIRHFNGVPSIIDPLVLADRLEALAADRDAARAALTDATAERDAALAEVERLVARLAEVEAERDAARHAAYAMRHDYSSTWACPEDCIELNPFPWEAPDAR